MAFHLIQGDIVVQKTEAIVNAANADLTHGGGVCGSIFQTAGAAEMEKACKEIGYCAPGKAVITPGFALKAQWVIHTVGPVWNGGNSGEETLLSMAYESSLRLAVNQGLKSIAFPLISAGTFGYPTKEAIRVAMGTIKGFLSRVEDLEVYLVLFDTEGYLVSQAMDEDLLEYIQVHYTGEEELTGSLLLMQELAEDLGRKREGERFRREQVAKKSETLQYHREWIDPDDVEDEDDDEDEDIGGDARVESSLLGDFLPQDLRRSMSRSIAYSYGDPTFGRISNSLMDSIHMPHLSFREALWRYIDTMGLKDPEVYHRANMDRKLFSKIRSNKNHIPTRRNVLALCIGLRLDMEGATYLMQTAGYAFSDNFIEDIVFRHHIKKGSYDIFEIEANLYDLQEGRIRA